MTRHPEPVNAVPLYGADLRLRALETTGSRHTPPVELGHEDVLLRLALWLAEVSAEAGLAAPAPAK